MKSKQACDENNIIAKLTLNIYILLDYQIASHPVFQAEPGRDEKKLQKSKPSQFFFFKIKTRIIMLADNSETYS